MTSRSTRARLAGLAAIAVALQLLFPAIVSAHAELLKRAPGNHGTVAGSPVEISATFSEPLVADGSTFSIRNAAGEQLAVGGLDPTDPSRLIIDPVPDLTPGAYEVRWRAATNDGHAELGKWTFTVVAAATPAPTATPVPTTGATSSSSSAPSAPPTASPIPLPSPSPAPGDASATSGDVILPIVVALALVALAAGLLLSRRRPA